MFQIHPFSRTFNNGATTHVAPGFAVRTPLRKNIAGRRYWLIFATLMLLAGLSAACGGGDGEQDIRIHPLSDIIVGDVSVAAGDSRATVSVVTSIPVVCSVIYGSDTTYGMQSTDMDMGGSAHENHAAILRNLTPGATYHFRLQGTAADGTVYVSDDATFVTEALSSDAGESKKNLARLASGASILEASSEFGTSWTAEHAIDGDPATEWSSRGDGDGASITVGLPTEATITGVGFWTRTMGDSGEVRRFRIVTDAGEILGPFDLPDADRMYEFEVDSSGQSFRFEVVESSGGNTGAVEVALFGEAQ